MLLLGRIQGWREVGCGESGGHTDRPLIGRLAGPGTWTRARGIAWTRPVLAGPGQGASIFPLQLLEVAGVESGARQVPEKLRVFGLPQYQGAHARSDAVQVRGGGLQRQRDRDSDSDTGSGSDLGLPHNTPHIHPHASFPFFGVWASRAVLKGCSWLCVCSGITPSDAGEGGMWDARY